MTTTAYGHCTWWWWWWWWEPYSLYASVVCHRASWPICTEPYTSCLFYVSQSVCLPADNVPRSCIALPSYLNHLNISRSSSVFSCVENPCAPQGLTPIVTQQATFLENVLWNCYCSSRALEPSHNSFVRPAGANVSYTHQALFDPSHSRGRGIWSRRSEMRNCRDMSFSSGWNAKGVSKFLTRKLCTTHFVTFLR